MLNHSILLIISQTMEDDNTAEEQEVQESLLRGSNVSENGWVRTSENSPLHKSNNITDTKKKKKKSESALSKLWKLTKDLQQLGAFIWEKWLKLSKTSELCSVLTCLIRINKQVQHTCKDTGLIYKTQLYFCVHYQWTTWRWNKKIISYTITSTRIKYLGINLT